MLRWAARRTAHFLKRWAMPVPRERIGELPLAPSSGRHWRTVRGGARMPNDDHVAELRKGVAAWNAWRREKPLRDVDLRGSDLRNSDLRGANLVGVDLHKASFFVADLRGANLRGAVLSDAELAAASLDNTNLRAAKFESADLSYASLVAANLFEAKLLRANLSSANLTKADLREADLGEANLTKANLGGADLRGAKLRGANLTDADLRGAILIGADLRVANLTKADLRGAHLTRTNLSRVDFSEADLSSAELRGADLKNATLVDTIFSGADLTGCHIHGISAWNLKLEQTKQENLVITRPGEPEITVDNIEVAQFVYLLLHNKKIRDVIETITSKAVLILGRFTEERKAVLDALREEVRKHDYLPILFDFDVPAGRDITETVSLLARMARFIIADLTDPSSIPKELEAIVPHLAVPVQPLLEGSNRPYAMFKDYWKYDWVLPVCRYDGIEPLLAMLAEKIIAPAEGKVKALEVRRRRIEAELIRAQ
jgi:uncharacterized protein YjbI with pentapeptide repeats